MRRSLPGPSTVLPGSFLFSGYIQAGLPIPEDRPYRLQTAWYSCIISGVVLQEACAVPGRGHARNGRGPPPTLLFSKGDHPLLPVTAHLGVPLVSNNRGAGDLLSIGCPAQRSNHRSAFRLFEVFFRLVQRYRDILRRKKATRISQWRKRGNGMPTSKKQMTKLNQVKKAKAEELSKQAAAGSKDARKS